MKVVGLTGGIACGKSTVADLLRARGFAIVDADAISREVVAPGEPALAAIVDRFGEDILKADGTLDRRALGARVFENERSRRALERVLHPAIAMASQARFAQLAESGAELAFYEAALLVEVGRHRGMWRTVVVIADEPLQRARLLARNPEMSEAEADGRIGAQMPLAEKAAAGDHVINNSGSLADLEARVEAVLEALLSDAGLPAPDGSPAEATGSASDG